MPYYRLAFRSAGLRSGILQQLVHDPVTAEQLASAMGYEPGLIAGLEAWLDAGVTLGELARRNGRYRVRRRSLKRLLRPENDPVAAFNLDMSDLQHRVLTETPQRLRTGERFPISDADPATIACERMRLAGLKNVRCERLGGGGSTAPSSAPPETCAGTARTGPRWATG